MEKKQTAVEWLWNASLERELMADDFEKAMEMEKEQIISAFLDTHPDDLYHNILALNYYNLTYKQSEQ